MKHAYGLVLGAAALAGCDRSPQVTARNASVAEVAEKVRASGAASNSFMRAGEWRVSSTVDEMNIPGMPPQAQAQMKQVMGQHQNSSFEYCLSAEEAKHPGGKFFSGKADNQCRYDHFSMGGGKIDAVMHCQGGAHGPEKMTMAINGTYSPDNYATRVSMTMDSGPEGNMSMKMHSDSKRIGECTAKDARETAQAK